VKKPNNTGPAEVQSYINGFEGIARSRLLELRALILALVPGSTEFISYGMPSFKHGKATLHIAGYKKHIGMYPAPEPEEAKAWGLHGFVTGPGTLQFSHDKDLPLAGIRTWVEKRL